ncbi:MAG: TetR/AcrR family transcriptional regulator [Acidothermales bacterium]|jgi:TetR/AcrR family transcriptional regulator|nr:TetR/AcrR family transcriptional regulator [Acidothermales bacterium]
MGRPRSNDYDGKRREILDRSAVLFAEHGFANTTVSMIAAACGASKGRLYHYYDSKEAVLFDLLDSHIRSLLSAVRTACATAAPSDNPRIRFELLAGALLRAYRYADCKHRVQLNDLGRLPPAQQRHIRDMERQVVDVFAVALLDCAPHLRATPAHVKPVTMSVLGMLNWQHTWFRSDGPLDLDDYVRLVVGIVLDGIHFPAEGISAGVGDRHLAPRGPSPPSTGDTGRAR